MKSLIQTLLLLFATYSYARSPRLPAQIPPSKIGVVEAVAKVEKYLGFSPSKKGWRVVAVIWSPLTCDPHLKPAFCYYEEPITHRPLNLALAGEPEEWSWFVTYAVPHLKGRPNNGFQWEMSTFQVRENGDVNNIDADRA